MWGDGQQISSDKSVTSGGKFNPRLKEEERKPRTPRRKGG